VGRLWVVGGRVLMRVVRGHSGAWDGVVGGEESVWGGGWGGECFGGWNLRRLDEGGEGPVERGHVVDA
jgi:hypothetical protein